MKSILQDKKVCYFCDAINYLEDHHIYGGSLRKISEKNGFKCYLCKHCHDEVTAYKNWKNYYLKRICQEKYQETHTYDEFMKLIGRNYIGVREKTDG